MSQPPVYARQYSFQAYQVANPEDPLPGQKVDQELNAVKVTLDAILANIALIQRDDGRLANSSVGTSQLDGALISLGFERPTAWVTATAYKVNAAVFQSSKLYICLVAHTSGVFATDLAALKWEQVIDFTTLVTDAQAARDLAQTYASQALASKNSAAAYATDLFSGGSSWYGSTTGTNAYTLATQTYQPGVRPDGFEAWFYVVNANTGAVDITVGPYVIDDVKTIDGAELVAGDWPAGSVQGVKWSATLGLYTWINGASIGKFARLAAANTFSAAITLGSTLSVTGAATFSGAVGVNADLTLTGTDASAVSGPRLILDRNSASPAVNDEIGDVLFLGRDSLNNSTTYARIVGSIVDPTDASEDGRIVLQTLVGGVFTNQLLISNGLYTPLATGGAQGPDTINASGLFDDGVQVTPITLAAEQATTSGTSIDFTGIPATAKRITVMLDGVSTNGTSALMVQIGDAGGIENTGYLSAAGHNVNSGATVVAGSTAGFLFTPVSVAAQAYHGSMVIELQDASNTWVARGNFVQDSASVVGFSSGKKATSATLDRVRLTTVNGTDAFDAGSVSVSYE